MAACAMKSRKHLARVATLPCVVCGTSEVQVHHLRMAPITGAGHKASDWLTLPLCQRDHADLHADIPLWEMRYGRQIDHIVKTLGRLYG